MIVNTSSTRRSIATRKHRKTALLAIAAGTGLLSNFASAQFFTWISTGSQSWSNGPAWLGGTPPSIGGAANYVLQFNNSLANTYTATHDLGAGFLINRIVFNSTSNGTTTLAQSGSNTLTFDGINPGVVQNNFGGGTMTNVITLNPAAGDFTISGTGLGSLSLTGAIAESGGARKVVINMTAPILNGQEVRLSGGNSYTGGLQLISGNLAIGSAAALGTAAGTIDGGSVQYTTALTVANNLTLNADLQFIGGIAGTFSGVLSGAGGVRVAGTSGIATLTLTGANTYTGDTVIDSSRSVNTTNNLTTPGAISVIGAAGRISSTNIRVTSGGTLTIGDSSAGYTGGNPQGRIADAAAITLNGGLIVLSSTSSVSNNETVGALTIEGGQNFITVTPGTTATAQLTFASLSRGADRGTVFFRGLGLGGTPGSNIANIFFTTAPALAGGTGGAGTPNLPIIPFAFGDKVPSAGGSTTPGNVGFVTYDGTTGVRILADSEYAAGFAAVSGTTNNLLLTASANPTTPVSINSLFIRNTATATIGLAGDVNTITFPAGNAGFIYGTNALVLNTPLDFTTNDGKFFTPTGNITVNGAIAGSNGITKIGSGGTLILNSTASTYTGPTVINGGTMVIASTAALGGSTQIIAGGSDSNTGSFTRSTLRYNGTTATTLTQDIKLSSGYFNVFSGTSTLTLSGLISGTGGLMINTTGNVAVTNTGNTYSGMTRVFSGNLVIGSDSVLGSGGGGVDLGATSTTGLILNGNWTTSRQVNISFASQIDTGSNNATLNGPLTGGSSLTKIGSGKLVLNSTQNTHTGSLVISAGTLEINGILGPSTNGVSLSAGAAIGGSGTIYRTVSAPSGAIVSPGNSVGVLTANAITATGADFRFESNGVTTDRIDLIGALTVSSGSNLINLSGAYLPTGSYTLFNYASRTGTSIALGTTLGGPFTYTLNLNPTNIVLAVVQTGNDYNWDISPFLSGPQDGGGTWTATVNVWDNILGVHANWFDSVNNVMTFGATSGMFSVGLTEVRIAKSLRFTQVYTLFSAGGSPGLQLQDGIVADSDAVLNIPVTMLANNTMQVAAGRTLFLGGGVTESGGPFNLSKTGAGTLELAGPAGYTGTTNITAGTLSFNSAANLSVVTINMNGGTLLATQDITLSNPVTMTSGSGFAAASGKSLTLNNSPTGAFALTKVGAGTLVLPAGLAHTGTTAILDGTMDVTVAGTNTATMSGAGTGALIKRGAGTLLLNGTTTRTGDTTVAAGTIGIDSPGAIGGGANIIVNSGAGVRLGTSINNSATPVGTISVNDGTLSVPSGSSDYYANRLEFTGGTFTFVGSSLFWFHMKQAGGSVTVPSIQILSSSNTTVFAGVTSGSRLQNDHTAAIDINVADGPNDIDLDAPSMVFSSAGTNTTFNKTGAGTMRTGASNTASFNVNGGRMLVNGTGNSGAYTVNSTGILGGIGTITGAVTINTGGKLAPGTSIGTLNTGTLVLGTGANFEIELDTTASTITAGDQVNVSGTVNVTGANLVFVFSPVTMGTTTTPTPIVIVRNDLTDAVTGSFAGLPRGGGTDSYDFDNGLLKFTIYYSYDSVANTITGGNDIALDIQAVPEPGAIAGVALAGLALRRRRRA